MPAVEDFDNFRLFLSSTPKTRWTALLKKARTRNLGLQRIQADRETLDRFQTAVFRKFGNADVDEQGDHDKAWPCYFCHRTFDSFQAVRRHEAGTHKVQHIANLYLVDRECKACLKQFPTKVQLRRHLTAIPKCLDTCRIAFPFGLGQPMTEVASGVELQRLTDLEFAQAEGPSITGAPFFCLAAGFDVPMPPAGFVNRQKGTEAVRLQRCDAAKHELPPVRPLNDVCSIPATLGPQRAILVAFGGRRREGDIIDSLQSFVASNDFKHVPTICVLDLVHGEEHDAARGAATAWCRAILAGMVIGVFCSPPCETWSIARHNALTDSRVVPVRSAQHPWGLHRLTKSQTSQVTVGSFLLLVSIALITLSIFQGGCAMLEHPAFIQWHLEKDAASIWRLHEMMRIMKLPGFELHHVDQCNFGMPARKPTFFAAWRLPSYKRCLGEFRAPADTRQVRALTGKNADGTYKTAIGKEYPAPLCRAIAHSFGAFALDVDKCAVRNLEAEVAFGSPFAALVKPFVVDINDSPSDFGADFVDNGELPLLALPSVLH